MLTSTLDELKVTISDHFALLQECGYIKPVSVLRLTDKVNVVQAITLHYCILHCKAEIDQFCEGLESCGVLQVIRKNPNIARDFFINTVTVLSTGYFHYFFFAFLILFV